MADHFEVVSDAPGFGSRFMESLKGILFGIVLLILAFPILWWGENRQNLADFIKKAQLIPSNSQPALPANTLVKAEGKIFSDEAVSDPKYLANTGNEKLLSISRDVEMYAWKEDEKTEKRGDKQVKSYDYRKEWTGMPEDSSRFYAPQDHENPPMEEKDEARQVPEVHVGSLVVDTQDADFHSSPALEVTESMLNPTLPGLQVSAGLIYIPSKLIKMSSFRSVAKDPAVGDLKLSFSGFRSDVEGSVVGDWDGTKIVPHVYKETESYLGLYPGNLLKFQSTLQSEHNLITWVIRIFTLMMMWMGLNLILGPILTILDSIPLVGGAGKFVIFMVTGALAFVLWFLTLILANLWLVLLVMAFLGTGIMVYAKRQKKAELTTY